MYVSESLREQARSTMASLNRPAVSAPLGAAAALAGSAIILSKGAAKAEQANPPMGKFVEANGVRLHYAEQGEGEPLLLLHGTGMLVQDFVTSGLLGSAAERFRVIAIDRPGFGYSKRPHTKQWTVAAQADLFASPSLRIGRVWRSQSASPREIRCTWMPGKVSRWTASNPGFANPGACLQAAASRQPCFS